MVDEGECEEAVGRDKRQVAVADDPVGEVDLGAEVAERLRFLEDGDKVKVGVRFMGRQIAHKDLGIELLEKFQAEIGDGGTVEQPITSEGRSMHMILAPPKKRK